MNREKEPGAAVLLAVSQEFGKSVDWLLTGRAHVDSKFAAAKFESQTQCGQVGPGSRLLPMMGD
jgi:hypothetical protein